MTIYYYHVLNEKEQQEIKNKEFISDCCRAKIDKEFFENKGTNPVLESAYLFRCSKCKLLANLIEIKQ